LPRRRGRGYNERDGRAENRQGRRCVRKEREQNCPVLPDQPQKGGFTSRGTPSLYCGYDGGVMQKKWVYDELAHARQEGITVDVGGVSYENRSPEELWKVLQRGTYMLDYEADTLGRITALHIDRVEPSERSAYKTMRCTKKQRSEKE
jgi:hypothetical protein